MLIVSLINAHIMDRHALPSRQEVFSWRNVIFSDEVTILRSNRRSVIVYCMNKFQHDARFVTRHERLGCISISYGGGCDTKVQM